MNKLLKILGNLGLVLLAIVLFAILAPIGLLIQILWNLAKFDVYLYNVALQIDKSGNVVCPELLDLLFINKKLGHRFGKNETVSCVIGLNAQTNTLSAIGRLLFNILGEEHCYNAVLKEYYNN